MCQTTSAFLGRTRMTAGFVGNPPSSRTRYLRSFGASFSHRGSHKFAHPSRRSFGRGTPTGPVLNAGRVHQDAVGSSPPWLPVAADVGNRAEELMSWEVTKALPESKSRGPSRRPRAVKPTAGQQRKAAAGRSSGRGPGSKAAGHSRGPRRLPEDLRERARGQLRRARQFRAWIDGEPGRTSADLARQEGLTRARGVWFPH